MPAKHHADRHHAEGGPRWAPGGEPKVGRAEDLKTTYDYFTSLTAEELNEKEHFSFEGYVRK